MPKLLVRLRHNRPSRSGSKPVERDRRKWPRERDDARGCADFCGGRASGDGRVRRIGPFTAVCFLAPDLAIPTFLYLLLVVLQSAVAEFAACRHCFGHRGRDLWTISSSLQFCLDINRPLDRHSAGYLPGDEPVITQFAAQSPGALALRESKSKAQLLYEAACQTVVSGA